MGAGNRTPVLRRAAWSHLSSPFFVFPRNPHNKPGMVVCQCAVLGKQRQEGLNSYTAQPGWFAPGSWEILPLKVDRVWGMAPKVTSVFTYGYEPIQNVYTQRREEEQEVGGRENRKKEGPRISRIPWVFSTIPGSDHEQLIYYSKGNEKKNQNRV